MKEVRNDWKEALPNLEKIGVNKFFEKLGPLLIGIELEKSRFSNNYRPYLSVSGLWGSEMSNFKGSLIDSDSIFYPEIYFPLNNSSFMGSTYFINNEEHQKLFSNMISDLKLQFLPLGKNVNKYTLINYINWYKTNKDLRRGDSDLEPQLLEFKYILALYFDDDDLMMKVENQIINEKDSWNKDVFELRFGDYDKWIKKIKTLKRGDLLNSIERVSNNPKIQHLKSFEIEINNLENLFIHKVQQFLRRKRS